MIPKKIHYCWLSGDPYPEMVQQCIDSWHKHMPDWEYVLWDMERVRNIDSVWLQECIEAKKWAFATDFIRVYALYHEGGVYLDSDVLLFQPIDCFLKNRFFIGRENISYHTFDDEEQVFLTSHCFGAEAMHPFLKLNMAYYENRHFIAGSSAEVPNTLRYDMLMMPYIQSQLAAKCYGYDPVVWARDRQHLNDGIEIYPPHYFCWMPYHPESCISERYARHLGQGSWREPEFLAKYTEKPVTFKYKIRWRVVRLLDFIAEKLDYKLVRIHPDGRI